jgi:RHS repeat-associated protein
MMFDAPTGLYRTLNRFYSPENQTWITRDPIGYEGGANVYAFVSGNPISATDPLGLEPRSALALPAGGATSIAARWGAEPGRFERIKEVLMGLFPDVDMPTIQRLTERVVNGGVNKITESVNTFVSNPVVQQVAANPVVQGVAQQTIQNSDKVPAAQEVANKVGNKVIESFQSNSNAGEGAAHSGQEGVNKVTNGTGGQLPDPGKGPNWIQKALEAKDVANRRCADDLANIMKQLQDAGRTKVYKVEFTPKVGRFLDAKDLAGNSINQHIANPSMPGWGNHLATYDPETGLIYDMITGGNGMKYADYMTKVFGANWKEFVLVNGK